MNLTGKLQRWFRGDEAAPKGVIAVVGVVTILVTILIVLR